MVHNGIEYGDMQLIAEAASLCRELGGLSAHAVAALFAKLNDGPLAGFLMETTAAVYLKQDATGEALVRSRPHRHRRLHQRLIVHSGARGVACVSRRPHHASLSVRAAACVPLRVCR